MKYRAEAICETFDPDIRRREEEVGFVFLPVVEWICRKKVYLKAGFTMKIVYGIIT